MKDEKPYTPYLPKRTNRRKLVREAAQFFETDAGEIRRELRAYRRLYRAKGYRRTLREKKTLCFEEAFLVYLALRHQQPERALVEIGTQYGQSTRRIVDMKETLDLDVPVICFDVVDLLKHCSHDEVEMRIEDLTGASKEKLFDALKPDFIYLDAHPYYLLKDVLESYVAYEEACPMAVHDCGRGLCNPHMTVPKEDPEVDSGNGVWERHVLAEVFGVDDPLDPRLDRLETETHVMRIFDTPHGLALIRRKTG